MKRPILPLIISLSLSLGMLTGCEDKKEKPPSTDKTYTCSATFNCGDFNISADIEREGAGLWTVELTAPDTLRGINLLFNQGEVTASYLGLSFTVPESALPAKNCVAAVLDALDSSAERSSELSVSEDGEDYILAGDSPLGIYTIRMGADGEIKSFELSAMNIYGEFSNFCETAPPTTAVTESGSEEVTTSAAATATTAATEVTTTEAIVSTVSSY